MNLFRLCSRDGGRRRLRGGGGGGFASRISGIVPTPESRGRGNAVCCQLVPSRILVVLVEETNAGDTSRPECPCEDQEKQPLAGTNKPGDCV